MALFRIISQDHDPAEPYDWVVAQDMKQAVMKWKKVKSKKEDPRRVSLISSDTELLSESPDEPKEGELPIGE